MNFDEAVIEGAAPRALTDSKDKVLELKLWARPPRFYREPTTRMRCWERGVDTFDTKPPETDTKPPETGTYFSVRVRDLKVFRLGSPGLKI